MLHPSTYREIAGLYGQAAAIAMRLGNPELAYRKARDAAYAAEMSALTPAQLDERLGVEVSIRHA